MHQRRKLAFSFSTSMMSAASLARSLRSVSSRTHTRARTHACTQRSDFSVHKTELFLFSRQLLVVHLPRFLFVRIVFLSRRRCCCNISRYVHAVFEFPLKHRTTQIKTELLFTWHRRRGRSYGRFIILQRSAMIARKSDSFPSRFTFRWWMTVVARENRIG